MNRWVVYQRERFPLAGHAPLIAAFSVSAVCFSRLARGEPGPPPAAPLLVAFVTALLFFLQLRIADEFKDFEDDARYRPYRPVPRGLVTLRELGWVGASGAVVQLALAVWLRPPLVVLLAAAWLYLALMSREFFAPDWLKAHPVAYMASHMGIIPLIDLYATACDWTAVGFRPPDGLIWFLLVSYVNGLVVEIGRKIRVPADEETGVETYSALWGLRRALWSWLAAVLVTAVFAWQAARQIDAERGVLALLALLVTACAWTAARLNRHARPGGGKAIEMASGVWTLLMYLSLGAVPAVMRWMNQAAE
jgi:4-hydroxybenzoate polyprenyltransferase